MKYVVLLLALLIFLGGCTSIMNFFGSDVIHVDPVTIEQGTINVVEITNIQTIPSASHVVPDMPVQLSFLVENKDLIDKADFLRVEMFDAPTFYNTGGQLCNGQRDNCAPSACSRDVPCILLPGEQKQILFEMMAPSEDDIVNIRTQPKINFNAKYKFESSLSYVFPVVDYDEVIRRQKAGDSVELGISKSHSSGPIQIDVELVGANYGLSNHPVTLNFIIRNKGKGNTVNSIIEKHYSGGGDMIRGFEIVFPQEFEVVEYPVEFFSATCKSTGLCKNTLRDVELFKDKSMVTMMFLIQIKDPHSIDPFRSFQIRARTIYEYELRDSVDITINPIGNA
ncbi:hypothetical protein ACFLQN_03605 [Candidatus Aenigmatarchaeota archaeon]